MSETDSFTDPVFLDRFGLSRVNAIDYFLNPLNPFKTKVQPTSNEVLAMQGIGIGILMQYGSMTRGAEEPQQPLSPEEAEAEYNTALSRLTGEQYELMPPADPSFYTEPSPLFTIRHVLRSSPTSVKVLGIYYIVQGVIYKAPAVRSVMKTNTTRLALGLLSASRALSQCARYHPAYGYIWVFEDNEMDPVALGQLAKKRKRRKITHSGRPGERTAAEEEFIRASEALSQGLVRLSRSELFE